VRKKWKDAIRMDLSDDVWGCNPDGIVPGLCLMADFGISGVELLSCTTTNIANYWNMLTKISMLGTLHSVCMLLDLDAVIIQFTEYLACPYDAVGCVSAKHTCDSWCRGSMDTAAEGLSHIPTSNVWLGLISKNKPCHSLDNNETSPENLSW
jgi:hypothetical protein